MVPSPHSTRVQLPSGKPVPRSAIVPAIPLPFTPKRATAPTTPRSADKLHDIAKISDGSSQGGPSELRKEELGVADQLRPGPVRPGLSMTAATSSVTEVVDEVNKEELAKVETREDKSDEHNSHGATGSRTSPRNIEQLQVASQTTDFAGKKQTKPNGQGHIAQKHQTMENPTTPENKVADRKEPDTLPIQTHKKKSDKKKFRGKTARRAQSSAVSETTTIPLKSAKNGLHAEQMSAQAEMGPIHVHENLSYIIGEKDSLSRVKENLLVSPSDQILTNEEAWTAKSEVVKEQPQRRSWSDEVEEADAQCEPSQNQTADSESAVEQVEAREADTGSPLINQSSEMRHVDRSESTHENRRPQEDINVSSGGSRRKAKMNRVGFNVNQSSGNAMAISPNQVQTPPPGRPSYGFMQQPASTAYPFDYWSAPSSASTGGFQSPYSNGFPPYQSHTVTAGVILPGYSASNNSSPGPSYPGGVPPHGMQHLPAYMAPPYFVPYQAGGHSHHQSDPHPSRISPYAPPSFFQNGETLVSRPHYQHPARHGGDLSFAPPEAYSPSGTPLWVGHQSIRRGIPSSHGTHSTGARHGPNIPAESAVPKSAEGSRMGEVPVGGPLNTVNGVAQHGAADVDGSSHPSSFSVSSPGSMTDTVDLQAHLLSEYNHPRWSDQQLTLWHYDDRFEAFTIFVHGVVVARSPFLRELLGGYNTWDPVSHTMTVSTRDRFISRPAFEWALKSLYGASLLQMKNLTSMCGLIPSMFAAAHDPTERTKVKMDFALAYAAAGHLLELPSVTQRGGEVAALLISWDTISRSLEFATEGVLGQEWRNGEETVGVATSTDSSRRRPSIVSNASEQDSATTATLSGPLSPGDSVSAGEAGPRYAACAKYLLHRSIQFIIHHFPADFSFNANLKDPVIPSRLPRDDAHVSTSRHSKLSAIRFGALPAETPDVTSSLRNTLSGILLDLPFPILKHILESEQLGGLTNSMDTSHRQKLARDVVAERERRRKSCIGNRRDANADGKPDIQTWNAAGWSEAVITTFGGPLSGVELMRKWKGFVASQPDPHTKKS